MAIKSKYVFDPIKKIMDKVDIFSPDKPIDAKPSSTPSPQQQFPKPEATQRIGRPRPTGGDATQGLGQRPKSPQGVVKEHVSYNPKSGEVQVGRQYGPTGKPPEAVYHGSEGDVATQKLGQKPGASGRGAGDTTQAMPKRPVSGEATQKIKPQGPLTGDKTQRFGKGKTKIISKPEPPAISPTSQEGMERITQRLPDVRKEARAIERRMKITNLFKNAWNGVKSGIKGGWKFIKSNIKGIGIAGGIGMAAGIIGFAIFEYAANIALEKMGYTDLSMFLPNTRIGQTVFMTVPYQRFSREEAPYYAPNVFEEHVYIKPPKDGAFALGVYIGDLPEYALVDSDINGIGELENDWLCAPYGKYAICASATGNPIMSKDKKTTVLLKFPVAGDVFRRYMQSTSGSRQIYLIFPKK